MATARKLPSGSWRVLVYSGTVNGKRQYQSFTGPTKREAEYKATQYLLDSGRTASQDMTVGEAIDRYIESKSAVLSPSTLREYRQEQRNHYHSLERLKLSHLTQEHVQRLINELATNHSPKTCANVHGLLSAAVRAYRPGLTLRTRLPQAKRKEVYVPTQAEVLAILEAAKGKRIELPILLAATMGLRRSEIVGLTWDNVDMDRRTIRIAEAVVVGYGEEYRRKAPKSAAGYRTLDMPPMVYDALKGREQEHGSVVGMTPPAIDEAWARLRRKVGVGKLRFHDLRHYYASVMLALGVPDKYAMERMGHATNAMLKTIYQHTLAEKEKEVSAQIAAHFQDMQHEMQHGKEKTP